MLSFPSADSFTINAIAQDDFSDVPIPDAPAQPAHTPNATVERPASEAMLNERRYAAESRAKS